MRRARISLNRTIDYSLKTINKKRETAQVRYFQLKQSKEK